MKKIFLLLLVCPLFSFNAPDGIDIFFGDSITFGNELGLLQYTARWTAKYTTAVNTEEDNFASSGATIIPDFNLGHPFLSASLLPDYSPKVKHVFISYWINDYLYGGTADRFAAATTNIVNVLMAKGWPTAKIVLCFNYVPTTTVPTDKALTWLSKLRSVQRAKGTSFLDLYTLISKRNDNTTYSLDAIHPTPEWNTIISDLAQKNIELPTSDAPLPSKLISFSGLRQGADNLLRWTVAQELNVKAYDIQKSSNGINWTSVGQVSSLGNTSTLRDYSFVDKSMGVKELYRIKEIDFNGSSEVSKIILITGVKPTALTINSLFPNPSVSTLNVSIGASIKEMVQLQIVDEAGRILQSQQSSLEAGSNTIDISVNKIPSGTYTLKLTEADHQSITSRFVKK